MTIGVLESWGSSEPAPGLRPTLRSTYLFAGVLGPLFITQLDRNGDASRPVALETRPHRAAWSELCPPAFPYPGPGECGLHGSNGHSQTEAASSGGHWPQ